PSSLMPQYWIMPIVPHSREHIKLLFNYTRTPKTLDLWICLLTNEVTLSYSPARRTFLQECTQSFLSLLTDTQTCDQFARIVACFLFVRLSYSQSQYLTGSYGLCGTTL